MQDLLACWKQEEFIKDIQRGRRKCQACTRETIETSLITHLYWSPRPVNAPVASRRQFLNELRAELPYALTNLQRGSIAPVDLAQASIGPGMAIYSRYSQVVESDGTPLRVRAALQLINRALDEVLAEQEGEYDAETRWAIAWFEEYAYEAGEYGRAETLSKAKNTGLQGLVNSGFLTSRAGKVRLLKRYELAEDWSPKQATRLTVWEVMQHMIYALDKRGDVGAGDILRTVGEKGEIARDLAYRLYYERRIQSAYPIHPELFNRLYNDWSSIEKFQRTRGVLRLMATIIHLLWVRQDASLLIMPASIPVEDAVLNELMHYVEDSWKPVIEKDVDGPHSLPLRLDSENTTLGRYSASRRVARTIYLGSAPNQSTANKGLPDNQIRLGCVQPGESIATFGDALRRLSDQSTHMYQDGQRYWYSLQPSVTRLAQDRAAQCDEDRVFEEIEKRLRPEQSTRGDFARVHVCPSSSADIADDEAATRLIILKPHVTHALRDQQSAARIEARQLLDFRGNTRRSYRNTLIFLAADRTRLEDLKQGVRQYLAWDSIYREKVTLNLDAFQSNQAETKRDEANQSVTARIPETYTWLLVPDQPNPQQPDALQEFKLQPQPQSTLTLNASRRLKSEEMLITQYAGVLLRREMDRIPLWRGTHVSIKDLADYFAKYVYLPRLKNTEVLLSAIRDGVQSLTWEHETFAYAESFDAENNRYLGLKTGELLSSLTVTAQNVLVKPEVAQAQINADAAARVAMITQSEAPPRTSPVVAERRNAGTVAEKYTSQDAPNSSQSYTPTSPKDKEPQFHRFYGSVKLNPRMMAGDAGKIMEEVVAHLTSLSKAGIEVTLEIQGTLPNGVPPDTRCTITENCRTLRFESYGFEEE